MTPQEQATRAANEMRARFHLNLDEAEWVAVYKIILAYMQAAIADAKAEQRREWEEKVRLVHGGGR